MKHSYYCQEKQEIAEINAEDTTQSLSHRAECAKAANMWRELADLWLELELRQGLFPKPKTPS